MVLRESENKLLKHKILIFYFFKSEIFVYIQFQNNFKISIIIGN